MPSSRSSSESPILPRSRARGPFPTAKELSREGLIASWYGEENRPSVLAGMHPRAQRITKFVEQFMDRLQGPEDRILGVVQAHWQEIANDDESILKLRPIRVVNGTLILEVPDATLHYVFQQPRLKQLLLEQVSAVSQGEIRQLRMVLRGRIR